MGMFDAIRISASALTAERMRLDIVANNLANQHTTRTPEGGPYRRQVAILSPAYDSNFSPSVGDMGQVRPMGVKVAGIMQDGRPPIRLYDPTHPDADAQGYVSMPNINVVQEMTDLITATRAYEANATVMNASKSIALRALDILR